MTRMKRSRIAAAFGFAIATTVSSSAPLPPPSDRLCTGRTYNFTYSDALAYTKARGIASEYYIVGPDAGGPPEKVTTGYTFARATVWGRTITGMFNNANKTACEVSPTTYNKYKPAPPVPPPAAP